MRSQSGSINLQQLATIVASLRTIIANGSEAITVRIKAAEVLALFEAPSLSAIQATFVGGTTNAKLTALGQLQGALIGGRII